MKVLLIGADGQLGTDLVKVLKTEELIPLTIKDLDITRREALVSVLSKYKPQIVVNTAAFNRTDDCEDQVETSFLINTIAVKFLAETCQRLDCTLVHFSTDYVFGGDKSTPYTEEDVPNPKSVYGISKLAGEQCVKYLLNKYFIVRTSGLYGSAGCMGKGGGNFVEGRIKDAKAGKQIRIIDDEILTPTYTMDLAGKIKQLINTQHYGLYHITNNGQCSWYQFGKKIFDLLGLKADLSPISSKEFKSKIERPGYSVLKNQNLQKLGMDDLPEWDQSLAAYLKEKGYL
ncbi:MAG: dTDP-4-dehydrorhamnose reductase [Candidatus Saganbacteria bacterium]|nr:dTDP-4-dehydrorhamnose reductase [Candidatus Saganbacteria bacterium]